MIKEIPLVLGYIKEHEKRESTGKWERLWRLTTRQDIIQALLQSLTKVRLKWDNPALPSFALKHVNSSIAVLLRSKRISIRNLNNSMSSKEIRQNEISWRHPVNFHEIHSFSDLPCLEC
ncbi:hypothetical protein SLE2022_342410 [Rubroshorea leprosula]